MKIRILSLIFAAVMLIILLPSCGETEPTKPQNVFRETEISLPDEMGTNYNIGQYELVGDTIYMMIYSYDENFNQSYYIQTVNVNDGSLIERIDLPAEQSENGGSSLSAFTVSSDGTIFAIMQHYSYGEEGYSQRAEVHRIKDGETDIVDLGSMVNEETGEEFYIYDVAAADDGSLILTSWNAMRVMTPNGELRPVEIEMSDGITDMQFEGLQKIDGKLYAQVWTYGSDDSGVKLMEFDHTTGTLGDAMEINGEHVYSMIVGPGYDYYYNDRSSLWGITIGSEEMTEVINFVNSDINGSDINGILPLSADRFFAMIRSYNNGRSVTELMFLDRVPEEEIVEKKMLRLAASWVSYDLRSQVIEFNKSSDEYRITIDDYSRYNTNDNYNAGTEKLNADIISGNIPDIFMLDSDSPYDVYASKGIFADLYELMDADEAFDRSQYVESIFNAYEYDGELLTLVPSVQIATFAAKKETMGDITGWTMAEFLAFAEQHPDMMMFDWEFDREMFLQMALMFARDQFIDKETGATHFDTDEFRALLEFAKSMPEQTYWETMGDEDYTQEFYQELENRFVEDRVLLATWTLYDIQYSYRELLNSTLKDEPTLVGFPVSEGNGAVMQATYEYAISRRSDFKEGAWAFLKTMIDEESQMPIYNEEYKYWEYPTYGVPVYRPALEKMLEIAMTPPEENDYSDVIIGGDAIVMPAIETAVAYAATATVETAVTVTTEEVVSDETAAPADKVVVEEETAVDDEVIVEPVLPDIDVWIDPYSVPLTEEQADQLLALIDGTTQAARYDEKLQNIIIEEAASFFAGTKTLDETVDVIQNRAGIYVNESR